MSGKLEACLRLVSFGDEEASIAAGCTWPIATDAAEETVGLKRPAGIELTAFDGQDRVIARVAADTFEDAVDALHADLQSYAERLREMLALFEGGR